jgi:hypothetical protein
MGRSNMTQPRVDPFWMNMVGQYSVNVTILPNDLDRFDEVRVVGNDDGKSA